MKIKSETLEKKGRIKEKNSCKIREDGKELC